ncbi:MAG: polyhydroxyalkanoate depolymerase [Hydrogenophaga sp.]|uniref:polyhydroxyalkanoate depolymerase n=1 Tax=Hydrogenophaga sp. TaxID=1904254 RepID=UPI00169EF0A2|nr:polyhydroxyalkanoate depolymerase [Hydrogenophaga sp.]NIM40653.1 polyhydroxyalkanoate depolymerase [Hydrogenophaga sp.]NIN26128.1 polyhydroxyalkanoate depolymerase [Hydrogenophaga sp.]NIN30993.1 polyhydroxyalkanoate depolymerase [Hydrogenophaga sp.]NIN55036.1 polyhydroxyalkanoate depolymerase [Hydrogenophaga sp.]NIO51079.1 polyhydroxyalkanoate depolymerase [Hydrogenophaga sp.]
MLYQAYQTQSDLLSPLRLAAQSLASAFWVPRTERTWLRQIAAACDLIARLRLTHSRPPYGIGEVLVNGEPVAVDEKLELTLPFGSLLHFAKRTAEPGPPVLLVAPLSGHFATLLRETARTLLQDHDVYITDWHNARDVHLRHGAFGLDDYIDYMMRFSEAIGPGHHVIAVCQPCVAALAATALMAEDEHPATPASLTLMAGPVDCRVNPTEVNRLATGKPIEWFAKNLISHVPLPHAGHMRRVYPGFVQLTAFMSMNPERHQQSFRTMAEHLVEGRVEEARTIQDFYEEYLAVNDLPAEFYLETVEKVFQTFDLARGELMWRGRRVNPAAIRRTALMTVEGERDDICSIGQTVAAQDLCTGIRPYHKTHHIQTGVGHYGVFSGRRWNSQIYPRVREHIHSAMG